MISNIRRILERTAKGKTVIRYPGELVKVFYEYMGWDRETYKPAEESSGKPDQPEAAKEL